MTAARWSPEALEVLYFVYRFWASERRPPDLSDIHVATGKVRREVRRILRELQDGGAVAFVDHRFQLGIVKAMPFSATATPLACFADDDFVSYLGCPAEVLTVGGLPMFEDTVLTIRSSCACCFHPITLDVVGQDIVRSAPHLPGLVIVGSPWEWEHGVPLDHVCDTIHFALDEDHGERFAREVGRRQVWMTVDQMREVARSHYEQRMRDPDWPPFRIDAQSMIEGFAALGVDVSAWR